MFSTGVGREVILIMLKSAIDGALYDTQKQGRASVHSVIKVYIQLVEM